MNHVSILQPETDALQLSSAILLYRSPKDRVYATVHPVLAASNAGGRPVLGPGRAATKSSLSDLGESIARATGFRGFVPSQLLYSSPKLIAWWCEPKVRRVWFESKEHGIGTTAADVQHPSLVFMAGPQRWFVFAVKADGRPAESTPLFKAPYFNVWERGQICTGNVELPHTIDSAAIAGFEDAFFRSKFTHANDTRIVKRRGGCTALWADQLKSPAEPLVAKANFVSHKATLAQMVQRLNSEDQDEE